MLNSCQQEVTPLHKIFKENVESKKKYQNNKFLLITSTQVTRSILISLTFNAHKKNIILNRSSVRCTTINTMFFITL